MRLIMSAQDARGPMILIWQAYASNQQEVRNPTRILVILSVAKDLAERSDTGRMAGV